MTPPCGSSQGGNHVWVRIDVVEAILENKGKIPKGWTARKRRRGQTPNWEWARAFVISNASPAAIKGTGPAIPFSNVKLRSVSSRVNISPFAKQSKKSSYSQPVTVQIDDIKQALNGSTVTLDPNEHELCTVLMDNSSREPPDDLTSLTHLHEPAVVDCLKQRYQQGAIYTYTGKILLALNPFRLISGLYGEDLMHEYWKNTHLRPPPHVYSIAQEAHSNLIRSSENQSILVSGESGAGKTVTTKIIMRYLTTLSRKSNSSQSIEAQVLQSNPILESFGNARTVRNDNSSRFGKFIEISFLVGTGKLIFASIETYLLEKIRLITQAQGERNYHIFYEVLRGIPQRQRQAFHIGNKSAEDFLMTSRSGTFDRRDGVDDQDTYKDLGLAMETVGFTLHEQQDIYAVICALMHCSNLTFVETSSDASEIDRSNPSLKAAYSLLGVSSDDLSDALCTCAIEARGEVMHKNLSPRQASKALEALMKATYAALFTYIVRRVNQSIRVSESPVKGGSTGTACIGVLDIFGFESFDVNSFEQLSINFCNEALQQQFNRYVFKLEQEEYAREGIQWSFVSFPDNQDVLDLIEKKHSGILSILDEQCLFPRSTDQTFSRAIYEKCMDHPRFDVTNSQRVNGAFSIEHYAGLVAYDSSNFLEKNKDELPKETTDLLMSSSRFFIANLGKLLRDSLSEPTSLDTFATPGKRDIRRTSSSLVKESVGSQFSSQLRELRERINQTTPHYVRCLKPNDNLIPGNFHPLVIADQLRCAGVLEAIRVSRVGFPQRFTHEDFVQRYRMLTPSVGHRPTIAKGKYLCEAMVHAAVELISGRREASGTTPRNLNFQESDIDAALGIQLGITKVFLRQEAFDKLEYFRNERLAFAAVRLQAAARGFLASIRFETAMWAVVVLQNFVRRLCAIRLAVAIKRHRSIIRIQSIWRVYLAEMHFVAAIFIAQWCQRNQRGSVCRKICTLIRHEGKAEMIQTNWRRHQAVESYRRTLELVKTLQTQSRGFLARSKLRSLKCESRDLLKVAAERDRFRAESARLKRELDDARRNEALAPIIKSENVKVNTDSNEVQRMKEEIECLKAKLLVGTSHHYNDSVIIDAERAAKDVELDVLRKEVAFLRCTSENARVHSPLDSASMISRSISSQKVRGNDNNTFRRRQIEKSPINDSQKQIQYLSFLSPVTNFLRSVSKKEVRSVDDEVSHKVPSFRGPLPYINVSSNQSVTSTSLLDGDAMNPVTYETMALSPMTTHMIQSSDLIEDYSTHESSFQLEIHRFHNTIRQGDEDCLKTIVSNSRVVHKIINETDPNTGESPLHMAVRSSNVNNINFLLELDAIANCQDIDGNTPLHLANNSPIIALLLEKGRANTNIPNIAGFCPLHFAVERRDAVAVQHLLRSGANVTVADDCKWFTPLHVICHPHPQIGNIDDLVSMTRSMSSRSRIVRSLCDVVEPQAVDPNSEDWEGNSPLHHVVTLTEVDVANVLSILLEKGGNPNAVNKRGQTPLHLLSHNDTLRQLDIFQEILHNMLFHGADPNLPSKSGCTALHLSLYHRDVDSAVQLMKSGASLHLVWNKPKRWTVFWKDMGDDDVLPLDMVLDDHSLHRILASISKRQDHIASKGRCMQCKTSLRTFSRCQNCFHCGRHCCPSCCQRRLGHEFFPKFCEVAKASWVCIVCEKILIVRKEDETLDDTQPTTSYGDEERLDSPTSF